NETPNFRLVTDTSAFTRKEGEPACPAEPAIQATGMCIAHAPAGKGSAAAKGESQPSARRNCDGCGEGWPEDMLFRTRRGTKKSVDKWPVLALRGSSKIKSTGATMGFGAVLVKRNDGVIIPIATVPASQREALGIKAANFGVIPAQLAPITITDPASGARPLT